MVIPRIPRDYGIGHDRDVSAIAVFTMHGRTAQLVQAEHGATRAAGGADLRLPHRLAGSTEHGLVEHREELSAHNTPPDRSFLPASFILLMIPPVPGEIHDRSQETVSAGAVPQLSSRFGASCVALQRCA